MAMNLDDLKRHTILGQGTFGQVWLVSHPDENNVDTPYALKILSELPNLDSNLFDPRNSYNDVSEWQQKAEKLASLFIDNFAQYTDNDEGQALVTAGPAL